MPDLVYIDAIWLQIILCCLKYVIVVIQWSCDIVVVACVYYEEYGEFFFQLLIISNIGY